MRSTSDTTTGDKSGHDSQRRSQNRIDLGCNVIEKIDISSLKCETIRDEHDNQKHRQTKYHKANGGIVIEFHQLRESP